jgi:hypothetical protein
MEYIRELGLDPLEPSYQQLIANILQRCDPRRMQAVWRRWFICRRIPYCYIEDSEFRDALGYAQPLTRAPGVVTGRVAIVRKTLDEVRLYRRIIRRILRAAPGLIYLL